MSEIRVITIAEFAGNSSYQVIRSIPSSALEGLERRLNTAIQAKRRYDLIDWNCESFAHWLMGFKQQSRQATDWAAIVAVVGLVAALG